jgi:DNA-directed RNA polymerase specialized sigma24 family protein
MKTPEVGDLIPNTTVPPKAKPHYVSNADFLVAMKKYKEMVLKATAEDKPKPRVPEYIGECLLKIATHLSYKSNFINYTYREDMILDGVENCLQYIDNFDPTKSSNPFAYFTQIIYYAFIRKIQKEKKQTYVKNKLIMEMPFELFELQEQDEGGEYANSMMDYLRNNNDSDYNMPKKKEAKKKKKNNLESFLEDENGKE